MRDISNRKRIWGWFFFDWASQPYNTLLLTFIFGPYVRELIGDPEDAQATWAFTVGFAGVAMALLAPILGAVADTSGTRMRWIKIFSVMYVVGAAGVWLAAPGMVDLTLVLLLFAIGLIGMEFATIFTNSMLPDLGTPEEIGRISGNGWAFGYLGGLTALIVMLLFFADNADTGKTLLGNDPAFGLDGAEREGTRFVGPLSALWYIVFMIPFFLWVRDPVPPRVVAEGAVKKALADLGRTLRALPKNRSRFAFLGASMFYRDGLNGTYALGAIFAAGVLNWSVTQTGVFGIIAVIFSAVGAWFGGKADHRFGPKPVIVASVIILIGVVIVSMGTTRAAFFGIPLAQDSALPDYIFYAIGATIGAAGGSLQSSSRVMMVHQADPDRMVESFGLYALSGKATAFLGTISIGIATTLTGSQQWGISPLIFLFLLGLVLLAWVKPQGDRAAEWDHAASSPSPR